MPVSRRPSSIPPASTALVDRLRPYVFHGAALTARGSHAVGDCLFCGGEGKFSVELATGLWRCWVCGAGTAAGGGNGLVWIRKVYERAAQAIVGDRRGFLAGVAADRRLLDPATPAAWGVCQSPDGTWLIPGYGTDGKLDQVYRRTRVQDKGEWVWRLLPTPGLWRDGKVHALHLPAGDFDPACPTVYVCEGPWDGMALWEVARASSIAPCQVIAVPGCNVWRTEWTEFCRGKHVVLMFDSDHPPTLAGYKGMQRVAKRLSGVAASVRYLRWGPEGYDSNLPSGYDVRDFLSDGGNADENWRRTLLTTLLTRVEDAPREWFCPTSPAPGSTSHHTGSVEALPCSTFAACEEVWKVAMRWRQDMGDALAVLLAVCASTSQAGNQLFLDLIGSPGSAKTTLCRGLLVSGHCVHLENITKLLSGFRKAGDGEKDCSFLARSNNKTWVTCEFDTLGTSPQYHELMGKVRRIFDGETSATYGNSDQDRVYAALRTPWIRGGTPKMMDHDQSQLGDRFIRYIITDPDEVEKRHIAKRALQLERLAMLESANCMAGSVTDPPTRAAHALTGGYVDWLRANIEEKLSQVQISEAAEDYCIDLAELSADMRARPQLGPNKQREIVESHEYKEMPTRLARQNVRLAVCLAVVLNKPSVDQDVLRILRKVALDTAAGHSLNIVGWMVCPNPKCEYLPYQECGGLASGTLQMWSGMTSDRLDKYIAFLRKIDVLDWRQTTSPGAWVLTDRVYELYLRVKRGTA